MTTQNSIPINLVCIKEGSRLRVRIITPGYYNDANCQFPRNIRVLNRRYECDANDVTLAKGPRGKYFYRINKNNIKILDSESKEPQKINLKVYGDDDASECVICMDQTKDVVFAPCGHYCACKECAQIMQSNTITRAVCPMCRSVITAVVERKNVG